MTRDEPKATRRDSFVIQARTCFSNSRSWSTMRTSRRSHVNSTRSTLVTSLGSPRAPRISVRLTQCLRGYPLMLGSQAIWGTLHSPERMSVSTRPLPPGIHPDSDVESLRCGVAAMWSPFWNVAVPNSRESTNVGRVHRPTHRASVNSQRMMVEVNSPNRSRARLSYDWSGPRMSETQ